MINEIIKYITENPEETIVYTSLIAFWTTIGHQGYEIMKINRELKRSKRKNLDDSLQYPDSYK